MTLTRRGRQVQLAVLVSVEDYEHMNELIDQLPFKPPRAVVYRAAFKEMIRKLEDEVASLREGKP